MRLGVLVVDDEDGIRRSLARVLREEGYSVTGASNGEEALRVFSAEPNDFDVVICDLLMPGIDGVETIERMNGVQQEVTKIILTGYGTLEASIKAIDAGIDGFITKPFENKELKYKIKECYLRRKMRQFIEPDIFSKLMSEPSHLLPRSSLITILFSDIRGFTEISSRISPEELAALLNKHYFHPLSEIIKRNSGMVDKYIGDGIMALFGAPVAHDHHAENAVNCAIEMTEKTLAMDKGFHIGIGIATGQVVTGMFGSVSKKEYTALGTPVNVAARLQKLAASGEIVISEATRLAINGNMVCEKAGSFRIARTSDPVVYYKLFRHG